MQQRGKGCAEEYTVQVAAVRLCQRRKKKGSMLKRLRRCLHHLNAQKDAAKPGEGHSNRPHDGGAHPQYRTAQQKHRQGHFCGFKAINWVVKVVPMFVPRMIPTVCGNESRRAFTRPIVTTDTALLLCTSIVINVPVSRPRVGVFVKRTSQRCRLSPASAKRPIRIKCIPPKNNPSPSSRAQASIIIRLSPPVPFLPQYVCGERDGHDKTDSSSLDKSKRQTHRRSAVSTVIRRRRRN